MNKDPRIWLDLQKQAEPNKVSTVENRKKGALTDKSKFEFAVIVSTEHWTPLSILEKKDLWDRLK